MKRIIATCCTALVVHCGVNAPVPEPAVLSDGTWYEIEEPAFGGSTYSLTITADSFYLQNLEWSDLVMCTDTCSPDMQSPHPRPMDDSCWQCTDNTCRSYAKGVYRMSVDDTVVFNGVVTDPFFEPVIDSAGTPLPFEETYRYGWEKESLILVKLPEEDKERKCMVKE